MKRREARWRQSDKPIRRKKTKPVKNTYRYYWQRRKKRKRDRQRKDREMEEQQKSDEVLARRLNLNISNFCEESVSASPSDSKKSDPENNQVTKEKGRANKKRLVIFRRICH